MNPEWLCYVNGQEYGPYTWPQLVQMAAAGNVVPSTNVRRNFDSQWYLAEHVPGLFSAPGAPVAPQAAAHPTTPPRATAVAAGKAVSKSGARPVVAAAAAVAPAPVAQPSYPQQQPAVQQQPQPVYAQQQPAVPKGRVVSAAPTAIAPAADTRPIPIAVNPVATNYAAPAATADEPIPGKKKDSTKQMVLYLGGAIVGVALLGTAALIWKFTRPPEAPKEVAVAPVILPQEEADPNVIAEENATEANPTDVIENAKPANKSTTKTAAKTATPTPTKTETAAAPSPLLKSIAAWKPIEKFGSVGAKSGLTCTKLSAYLAADVTGRRVVVRTTGGAVTAPAGEAVDNGAAATVAPAVEGNVAETPPIAAPLVAPAAPTGSVKYVSAEAAPFLFVEMTITNKDSKPLTYGGCNSGATSALLIDAAGKPFSLVPVSGTPNVVRQPAGKEVQPGEAIQDTLVFAVPANADLLFRFALPRLAFSSKLPPGAWGYEIGGAALAASAQPVAAIPGQPTGPIGRQAIPIPGLQDPPPMPMPVPVQPAPAQPADPEMKKPEPKERIPIPGLTDEPEKKPAGPKTAEEVPNLNPPPATKK
jgi:hypothetical protein